MGNDVIGAVASAAFQSPIDEDAVAHVRRQFTQCES